LNYLFLQNTSQAMFQQGVFERIHMHRQYRWITRAQHNKLMIHAHYNPEGAMRELDALEQVNFWKRNSTCNVYTNWLGVFMLWLGILYQCIVFVNGDTYFDQAHCYAIGATFFGMMLLDATDPINYQI